MMEADACSKASAPTPRDVLFDEIAGTEKPTPVLHFW
jgi:hypothetical protein